MGKANRKANRPRPLLSDRKLPQAQHPRKGTSFELSVLPTPMLKRESDVSAYLVHELPEWINAVARVVNPEDQCGIESTLMWDLRHLSCLIGCTLAEGRVPFVERSCGDSRQSMTVEAVARCIGPDPIDARRFLGLLAAEVRR